jgi:hypothetical protein
VWNLRAKRCFGPLRRCFRAGCDQFGFALNEYSVQGNHLHLICEADDSIALTRGMQGLGIRMAKALNRVMARAGAVFSHRYHARVLRTLNEIRRAFDYVMRNAEKHARQWGKALPAGWIDDRSSTAPGGHDATAPPHTRLLALVSRDPG